MSDAAIPSESLSSAIVSFGRLLKEHGFTVSIPSMMTGLEGIRVVGVERCDDFREALRSVFMTRIEEAPLFDRLYEEFWDSFREALENGPEGGDSTDGPSANDSRPSLADAALSDGGEPDPGAVRLRLTYSPQEALKEKDFRDVTVAEDEETTRLIQRMLAPLVRHVSARRRPFRSGVAVDFRRLLRKNAQYGGEIFELPRMRSKPKVKKIVFLCDVSGSMNPYMSVMLQFIREIRKIPTKVETFVFATRLSGITDTLNRLPFHKALEELGRTVRDWSGGTRIGECLGTFRRNYGSALLRPSTVVVIHSDGWDRGDPALLEAELKIIRRRAYRAIWINPLLGRPSYEPTCRGMKAALPHVDAFLSGRNLAGLERVAGTLRSLF